MGCLCVGVDVLVQKPVLDISVLPSESIDANASTKNISEISASITNTEYAVKALYKNIYSNASAKVEGTGISVCASLVCSVGPLQYYYLLVDEGYLLTLNGEYFTVEKNESL